MEKGLRLIRFPKDGNMITILPSTGNTWSDEPLPFYKLDDFVSRYIVISDGIIHARISCMQCSSDDIVDINIHLTGFENKECVRCAILALMDYCTSNNLSYVFLIKNTDVSLKGIMESFGAWERYYNRYEGFDYYIIKQ